ncbi:MAG: hypothetical protein PHS49_00210 [Candidatus Gracilibacteria bacterium]|nr:hypothetical protein [Candidatus Gracilibacteria bacterium]
MKKLLIILSIILSIITTESTYSAWYGNHGVSYSNPGSTALSTVYGGGPNRGTFCNGDNNPVGETTSAVALNNSSSTLSPHGGTPMGIAASGTMRCLYWDGQNPTVGYNLSGGTTTNNTWTNSAVTSSIVCNDTGGSGCNASSYQYRVQTTSFTCNSGGTWTAGSSYFHNTANNTNLIQYICFRARDVSGNGYVYSSVATIKIDKKAPIASDITGNGVNLNNTYFIASNSKDFSISVDTSGGSPIVSIKGQFEKNGVSDNSADSLSSTSSPFSINRNVSNVDINRNSSNYRDYTFVITEIKDQAGNYMSVFPTYTYHVYAGNIDNTNSSVTGISQFSDVVTDGNADLLTINLRDAYNNKITPVDYQNGTDLRNVTLKVNYINNLYTDQLNNTGIGVESTGFDNSTYNDMNIGVNQTKSTTISDVANNDGIYLINFKVYAPTYKSLATDGRQFANGNFKINNIYGNVSGFDVSLLSNLDFQYKPVFNTTLGGEIYTNGFVEGSTQTGSIVLNQNAAINPSSQGLYFLQTGSSKDYFTGTGFINTYKYISKTSIGTQFIYHPFTLGYNYILGTLFELIDGAGYIDDIKDLRLNGYIRYTLAGKSITYLAGIFNDSNTQNFETLKIYGITNIDKDKQKDIIANQDTQDIQNLSGEITKSSLRRDIRKNAINVVKYVDITNGINNINNLTGANWSNTNNGGNKLGNVLYFGPSDTDNVVLDDTINKFQGRKTIVVLGKNLYIKSNIINDTNSDILGIIVLQDDNGNGGKVYIDTGVQEVDAIIYADKSVMSYTQSYGEIDGYVNKNQISNQLYILGTVFSENTIGGSRLDPPVCPFYTNSIEGFTCDSIEAQKYDFNYLRSGKNNKYNPAYPDYPIVIKYNPMIQSTPPPLFDK